MSEATSNLFFFGGDIIPLWNYNYRVGDKDITWCNQNLFTQNFLAPNLSDA